MPTYDYRCENGHLFEVFQSMFDDPLTTCEVCGAPVQRVLSAPAVHFKGSGFYTTDYKNKEKGSGAKSGDGGSKSEGGGSDSKSSDSKSSDSSSKSDSKSESKSKD